MSWDPTNERNWATAGGMLPVPWFGPARANAPPGTGRVLLDGHPASFGLLISDDPDSLLHSDEPLSWAWSSYLRRALVVGTQKQVLFLRTWGERGDRQRFPIPRTAGEADRLIRDIASTPRPRPTDVITQMLSTFKALRAGLAAYNAPATEVVHAFNVLITAADRRDELESCRELGDVAQVAGIDVYSLQNYARVPVEDAIFVILNSSPPLDSDLLVRHAAGRLFQEAHFELERQAVVQMSLFGGRMPVTATHGKQQRDARFTPTELARSLVERSIESLLTKDEITVLDPACGCGVFLLEVLRELEARQYTKSVRLVGLDSSPVSEVMARFCLDRAVADARKSGMSATCEVRRCDAMTEDWGRPDLILMNPPFASVNEMEPAEREAARVILGAGHGKFDKSMVFMYLAGKALGAGGVMASVLPSTLFDSANGQAWREAMTDLVNIKLLGRFHGYGYFQGALVEPGFVVAEKKTLRKSFGARATGLTVVVADEGSEDAALRTLRKGRRQMDVMPKGVHASFDYPLDSVTPSSWMPRTFAHERLLAALADSPRVDQLFNVVQGAHTGANDVFILSAEDLSRLPPSERRFFRLAAGTKTIRNGQLLETEYVFFPYDSSGLTLKSEDDLKREAQVFYATLKPHEPRLAARASLIESGTTQWWALNRARNWQLTNQPRILSGYFGGCGRFAYDETGRFVCVHGYAWFPLIEELQQGQDESLGFHDTQLPWAYTALLNSREFEVLLSCYCSKVQGGQYNLSKHFVNHVPLPDMFREEIPAELVADLAELGKRMASGTPVDSEQLSLLATRAYGVPLSEWEASE